MAAMLLCRPVGPEPQFARSPSMLLRSSRAMYQALAPGFCRLLAPYSLIW
jgi:hypothetical protein